MKTALIEEWRLQNDFKERQDIEISQSINTGTIAITLWASECITESTMDNDRLLPDSKHPISCYEEHREIEPSTDFLR